MRKLSRPILIALSLMLWVVAGPVGMAFDGCAMMGSMCEAPCGISSYIAGPVATGLAGLRPLAFLMMAPTIQPPLVTASPLIPPPKSALLSA